MDKEEKIVYVVVNFGRVVGVYENVDDAMTIIKDFATRGQLADLTIKKLQ